MSTLDVESLCTSIALDETIVICINQLLENTGMKVLQCQNLNNFYVLATKESHLKCYKHIGGVGMGSPFGPSLAKTFL